MVMTDVVLVTGASAGMGKACAGHLHARGYRVYGGSRSLGTLDGCDVVGFETLGLDVRDGASAERAIERILNREGRLDVLVNCAGYGLAGAVEDTTLEEAQRQLDTNFFGVARLCRAALPVMRYQRSGLIVNVGSMVVRVPLPYHAYYCASKAALESFTEVLRMEAAAFGVRVCLVSPGEYRTGFSAARQRAKRAGVGDHAGAFRRTMAAVEATALSAPLPSNFGPLVERLIRSRSPHFRAAPGPVVQRILYRMRPFLPQSVLEAVLVRHFRTAARSASLDPDSLSPLRQERP